MTSARSVTGSPASIADELHELRRWLRSPDVTRIDSGFPGTRRVAQTRAFQALENETWECPALVYAKPSTPELSWGPAGYRAYNRGCAYAIVAALCAEGVAPELELLPFAESPDVAALAARVLRAWMPADEQRYVQQVQRWLKSWYWTDRWWRVNRLLAHLCPF